MMGVIVLFDTRIGEITDESGLNFFSESIQYNPKNTGALFNIIEGFGLSVNSHKDINLFNIALQRLNDMHYEFSNDEKDMIKLKIELANRLDR